MCELWASRTYITPSFSGFNFWFVWFSVCLQKEFLKEIKESESIEIKAIFFPALYMILDLCRENEGNPFSREIWVVGSYTDTPLLSRSLKGAFKWKVGDIFWLPGIKSIFERSSPAAGHIATGPHSSVQPRSQDLYPSAPPPSQGKGPGNEVELC